MCEVHMNVQGNSFKILLDRGFLMNNIVHKTFAEIDLQDPFFQSLE